MEATRSHRAWVHMFITHRPTVITQVRCGRRRRSQTVFSAEFSRRQHLLNGFPFARWRHYWQGQRKQATTSLHRWQTGRKCAENYNKWHNNFFLNCNQFFVMSNHNRLRVLFDTIVSVHFIWKIYYYVSIENGQLRQPALCQLYRHTFVP